MQATTKRWVRRALVGVAVAVVLGAGLTVYLLRRPPAVWTEAQQILEDSTPEQRRQQADAVAARLSALLDSADDNPPSDLAQLAQSDGTFLDDTAELKLTNEELIALAHDMFHEWASQRGYEVPAGITEPVVLAVDGRLAIAFEIQTQSWSQVFSGYVDLSFKSDGMALGRVDDLVAGSLPVSVVEVGTMLRKRLPKGEQELADRIGEWVSQLEAFEFRPVLELEERRRARILAMAVGSDSVTLTMRVQDHLTYKRHNALLGTGQAAVTDELRGRPGFTGSAIADVPATTE